MQTAAFPIPYCWLNGAIVPAAEAAISVYDHGLLYGDGVFEGLRFYQRTPFRIERHLQRLQDSAAALGITLPYDADALREGISALISRYDGESGYLRLVVTRGPGNLGLNPRNCATPNVFILADQLSMASSEAQEKGLKLIIASVRRTVGAGLDPRVKSLNYLTSILARMEANVAGADEALLLNERGQVAEASAENLFIVRQGRLLTPPTSDGALAGVTRSVIMELAQANNISVSERTLTPYDLYTADECFLTGSGAGILPVAEVDGRPLRTSPGEILQRLRQAFAALIAQECSA
ncbi:branched-chain-amino-acid transaminase [Hahella sp. HN01]|uniref:branched-chain-amino-acid transaminase n=1 Tax=Hahella sp. HN01 TaxID=2847262 RepID=UPI001C1F1F43|nr:branched-chain-amino-acid transaminase [Hahella sp. HN01]MBU6950943.1 branched-chain-amino-acid transaminase [Hahella sp. HN01]